MSNPISEAVVPVVDRWLRDCPGQPLVLMARGGSVECSIGMQRRDQVSLADAARIIGVSERTFRRRDFFGLKRNHNNKFSRLAVERERDRQRS
jgi:hypothetical protein